MLIKLISLERLSIATNEIRETTVKERTLTQNPWRGNIPEIGL